MVRVEPSDLPVPGLVLLALTRVMGLANLGLDEKTAWHVPLTFRGHRVTIAHQKFGLRLYIVPAHGTAEAPEPIGAEIVRRLQQILRIVERHILSDYAASQIREGRLTIANRSGRLRAMYEHFRGMADAAFLARQAFPQGGDGAEAIFVEIGEHLHQAEVGAWNSIAAVNAYFSVLEHELVLLTGFSGADPTDGALERFIGDGWGVKFKAMFDLAERDTKRMYDRLHEVAESYRNPYSHGGFDKQWAAFWFHLEGIGAVPARLSDIRTSPHFEAVAVQPHSFDAICKTLDETDAWLRSGRFAPAFEWIDAGLHVAFDPDSRESHRQVPGESRDPQAAHRAAPRRGRPNREHGLVAGQPESIEALALTASAIPSDTRSLEGHELPVPLLRRNEGRCRRDERAPGAGEVGRESRDLRLPRLQRVRGEVHR